MKKLKSKVFDLFILIGIGLSLITYFLYDNDISIYIFLIVNCLICLYTVINFNKCNTYKKHRIVFIIYSIFVIAYSVCDILIFKDVEYSGVLYGLRVFIGIINFGIYAYLDIDESKKQADNQPESTSAVDSKSKE